ncbi:MAG: hypothetical protein AVDCRST_MAG05-2317, partial [uncultured Rubrobacteraceae bacterium]
GQAARRRGAGFAGARRPLRAARASRPRPAAGRPRLPAGQPHGVLSYRAHDPALRRWHRCPERFAAPL